MLALEVLTVVGLAVTAALVWLYLRERRKDLLGAIVAKRKNEARLQSRAWYVEGTEELEVALALVGDTFYYENPDLDASFDLDRIDEVEYADELATGHDVRSGCRVLRLRSHGAAFEFLLEKAEAEKWMVALPPRMFGNQPTAQAV